MASESRLSRLLVTVDNLLQFVSTYTLNSGNHRQRGLSSRSRNSRWSRTRNKKTLNESQQFERNIVIRLNKISLNNFSNISNQLTLIFENEINELSHLQKFVYLIFDKAINLQEAKYCKLFARLCSKLSEKPKSFHNINIKTLLLKQFHSEFEKWQKNDKFKFPQEKDQFEYTRITNYVTNKHLSGFIKQRKVFIFTLRFIGELFVMKLLPNNIIIHCLRQLLIGNSNDHDDHLKLIEFDIECSIILLQTIKNKLHGDNDEKCNDLSIFYRKLVYIENDIMHKNKENKYTLRTAFLIRNLISTDLRKQHFYTPLVFRYIKRFQRKTGDLSIPVEIQRLVLHYFCI